MTCQGCIFWSDRYGDCIKYESILCPNEAAEW